MADSEVKTFHRPLGIRAVVSEAEAGSGIVNLTVLSTVSSATDNMVMNVNVMDSTGKDKTNSLNITYGNSGVVAVADGDTTIDENDIISFTGMFV